MSRAAIAALISIAVATAVGSQRGGFVRREPSRKTSLAQDMFPDPHWHRTPNTHNVPHHVSHRDHLNHDDHQDDHHDDHHGDHHGDHHDDRHDDHNHNDHDHHDHHDHDHDDDRDHHDQDHHDDRDHHDHDDHHSHHDREDSHDEARSKAHDHKFEHRVVADVLLHGVSEDKFDSTRDVRIEIMKGIRNVLRNFVGIYVNEMDPKISNGHLSQFEIIVDDDAAKLPPVVAAHNTIIRTFLCFQHRPLATQILAKLDADMQSVKAAIVGLVHACNDTDLQEAAYRARLFVNQRLIDPDGKPESGDDDDDGALVQHSAELGANDVEDSTYQVDTIGMKSAEGDGVVAASTVSAYDGADKVDADVGGVAVSMGDGGDGTDKANVVDDEPSMSQAEGGVESAQSGGVVDDTAGAHNAEPSMSQAEHADEEKSAESEGFVTAFNADTDESSMSQAEDADKEQSDDNVEIDNKGLIAALRQPLVDEDTANEAIGSTE
mmetsp:Transcript_20031/g.58172  ORF Transcript_20031/g.58172 Transcript_20031/m.58172 type:complete len:491 (-) Transcript_20031:103-1575(-)